METDNVRRIRSEDGLPDDAGGSGEVPASEGDVISLSDFDNVIQIAELDDSTNIEVIDQRKDPGYVRQQIREHLAKLQEQKNELTEFEKESYEDLANHPWFRSLASTPRIMLAVLQCPPFYLYKLKSTGHHVQIKSYEIAKKGYKDRYLQGEIGVTISIKQVWNQDLFAEREVAFCPLSDLERLQHIKMAQMVRLVSHGAE